MATRAQTYVDRGKAVVSNRWMTREWSSFMGNTASLVQCDGDFDWIGRRCPEFSVVIDGARLGVMDFGEVRWSEESDDFGASLVARQVRPGLTFTIRTTVFHDVPGLLRSTSLRSSGDKRVRVARAVTESLCLAPGDVGFKTHGFAQTHAAIAWRTEERAAAIVSNDRGLIFGKCDEGVLELFEPDEGLCAVAYESEAALAPGDALRFPDTFLVPYTGNLQEAVSGVFSAFLLKRRRMYKSRDGERPDPTPPSQPQTQHGIAL